eukprot:TRINITY_DN2023_c0_g1_i2.p1 TRINITY_DN2023_c0_g1~~TRINITY_DN2023_c0_g1_i2.p1  ORF type:complete len:782 (-),score=73.05 TRINITY_DN2023_c0_g1_i2:2070-4415(-)
MQGFWERGYRQGQGQSSNGNGRGHQRTSLSSVTTDEQAALYNGRVGSQTSKGSEDGQIGSQPLTGIRRSNRRSGETPRDTWRRPSNQPSQQVAGRSYEPFPGNGFVPPTSGMRGGLLNTPQRYTLFKNDPKSMQSSGSEIVLPGGRNASRTSTNSYTAQNGVIEQSAQSHTGQLYSNNTNGSSNKTYYGSLGANGGASHALGRTDSLQQNGFSPRSFGMVYRENSITNSQKSPQIIQQQQHQGSAQLPAEPMTPAQALQRFRGDLTDYEQSEILQYPNIYYLGRGSDKIRGNPNATSNNFGYDDERGDYCSVVRDHIIYRYEILGTVGKGSFGQVLKCFDYKSRTIRAVKIIRNKKRFHHQAMIEIKILERLRLRDEKDEFNMVNILGHFYFRNHLCIAFELLSINLYEFIKQNNFQGLSVGLIRRFATQILECLRFLKMQRIIHCDLKPENILLKQPNRSSIKVIDFGSSCFENEKIYTYIQSRFYRSPEVIMGLPYTMQIDMWSFGCILAELFTGFPIFPGENEQEQLLCMMETLGVPPRYMVEESSRRKIFFDSNLNPKLITNSRGKKRQPGMKSLQSVLKGADNIFVSFVEGCLRWDPTQRFTPDDAMGHPWIMDHLPAATHRARNRSYMNSPATTYRGPNTQYTANTTTIAMPTQGMSVQSSGDSQTSQGQDLSRARRNLLWRSPSLKQQSQISTLQSVTSTVASGHHGHGQMGNGGAYANGTITQPLYTQHMQQNGGSVGDAGSSASISNGDVTQRTARGFLPSLFTRKTTQTRH